MRKIPSTRTGSTRVVIDPAAEPELVADGQPERARDGLRDGHGNGSGALGVDRPAAGHERGPLLDPLRGSDRDEVAHRVRVLARQGERVGASESHDLAAGGRQRPGQFGADGVIGGGRAVRGRAERDLDVDVPDGCVRKGAVEARDGDRVGVDGTRREQGRGEERDEPGRPDDRPVGAGAAEADPPGGGRRRQQRKRYPCLWRTRRDRSSPPTGPRRRASEPATPIAPGGSGAVEYIRGPPMPDAGIPDAWRPAPGRPGRRDSAEFG